MNQEDVTFQQLVGRVNNQSEPASFRSKLLTMGMYVALHDAPPSFPESRESPDLQLEEMQTLIYGFNDLLVDLKHDRAEKYERLKQRIAKESTDRTDERNSQGIILPRLVETVSSPFSMDYVRRVGDTLITESLGQRYRSSKPELRHLQDHELICRVLDRRNYK